MAKKTRRPKSVIVQVETWVPRPHQRDPSKLTKKRVSAWVDVGRWPVLYADRRAIVVRQFGVIAIYEPTTGCPSLAGYDRDHSKSKLLPEKHGWFRLQPESLAKLRGRK
jgi:hypothetical protein